MLRRREPPQLLLKGLRDGYSFRRIGECVWSSRCLTSFSIFQAAISSSLGTSASVKGFIGFCPRSGMLLKPRAPSTAVEGGGRRLRQDVLHIVLGVDQADRAAGLAVTVLPSIDHELAVSDLHPAVTLLVQD